MVSWEFNVPAILTNLTAIFYYSHHSELTCRDAIGAAWLFDLLLHRTLFHALDILVRVPLACSPIDCGIQKPQHFG